MDNNSINEKSYSELDPQLHFLGHLALALSTTCLLESEIAFVPGLIMFLPLFYGFLWISYVSKGRRILSTSVSNVLGILISVLGCFWVFSKVSRDVGAGAQSLPMPTALVPFVGPILAFLVMLRLFGPKGRRDFWILQGMGMLQVSLACVLTFYPLFGFLNAIKPHGERLNFPPTLWNLGLPLEAWACFPAWVGLCYWVFLALEFFSSHPEPIPLLGILYCVLGRPGVLVVPALPGLLSK
jgi:hypothetical protein